jgi:hypothetical protein
MRRRIYVTPSTCAISIQNKNNALGTNPSVVSRVLVLFYLILGLFYLY